MAKEKLNIRVGTSIFNDISTLAERRGITKSAAAEELIILGLSANGSVDVLSKFLEDNNVALVQAICEQQQKQIEAQQKQLDRIGKDLSIIKKNDRYGDQASLATLAWVSWYSQYLQYAVNEYQGDGGTIEKANYDNGLFGAKSIAKIGATKTYSLFWDIGGNLCRDPKEILRALGRFGEVLSEEELMDITGKTKAELEKQVSYTDSEAISKLAEKSHKKGREHDAG